MTCVWPRERLKREAIENPAKREEIEKEMSKIKTEMEEQSGVKIDYIKEGLIIHVFERPYTYHGLLCIKNLPSTGSPSYFWLRTL